MIRNPDHAADLRAVGVEPRLVNLEHESVEDIANEIAGSDALVFSAGAGPGSGEARKQTMDRDGAIRLIEAAREKGVARYVMVSSYGADSGARGDGFAAYLRAKGEADDALAASGLEWTIVRPGALTNDAGTGRIAIARSLPRGQVTRDDVASVLAGVLDRPNTIGRDFDLMSGERPIDAALDAL